MIKDYILPQGASIAPSDTITRTMLPSKTYRIANGRIAGYCDGIEALKQTISFILSTERYESLIYSWNYGSELKGVIGLDRDIGESELKRRIKEALIQDDRINSVDNFTFIYDKDSVTIEFTVFSIYEDFKSEVVI